MLQAEADAFVAQHAEETLPDGRQRVVRHGYSPERSIRTGSGALDVRRPKVRERAASCEWQRHFASPRNVQSQAQGPERFLLKLAEHWRDTPVEQVRPETIRQAARRIYPRAKEPTWNRQVIKPTRAAINYAAELGWCQRISVKRVTKNPEKKIPAMIERELAFHEQAKSDGLPHLGALCMSMFVTAARTGESCRLTWQDVDLGHAAAELHLFEPTPWSRTAHLPPDVVAAPANIPSNRKSDELVFGHSGRGSVRGPWNNVCERAGIESLTPHCCRHGFATSVLHLGFDPKTVAERGGWKDATTVLRTYAHAMKDRAVTYALFGTSLTQSIIDDDVRAKKQKVNSQ